MSGLIDAIVSLNEEEALSLVRRRLEAGEEPMSLVEECRSGMAIVGERYQSKEYFLGELIMSGEIFKQATTRISTGRLNKAFEMIATERAATTRRGKKGRPKIYYATQIAVNPVTIITFVNRPELFDENYRRFIIGRLQSLLPISEVPIRLLAKPHRG